MRFTRRSGLLFRPQMENDVCLLAGRHPDVLAPFGDVILMGRADAVLTLRQRSEPEAALIVRVGGLKAMALGGLQSDSRPDDSRAVRIQDLACNGAQPSGPGHSPHADGQCRAQPTSDYQSKSHGSTPFEVYSRPFSGDCYWPTPVPEAQTCSHTWDIREHRQTPNRFPGFINTTFKNSFIPDGVASTV